MLCASQCCTAGEDQSAQQSPAPTDLQLELARGLQQFKFAAARLHQATASSATIDNNTELKKQLTSYIDHIKCISGSSMCDALEFWNEHRKQYSTFVSFAEDLLAAPASQAFVERLFSVCGLLTSGRRNRMSKSLEIRAVLKLNLNFLKDNGF
jgi:hypothetical protein